MSDWGRAAHFYENILKLLVLHLQYPTQVEVSPGVPEAPSHKPPLRDQSDVPPPCKLRRGRLRVRPIAGVRKTCQRRHKMRIRFSSAHAS
jgi:hypothetical protein